MKFSFAYFTAVLGIILMSSTNAISQQSSVSGQVVDSLLAPIPGANVVLHSITDSTDMFGSASNVDGEFSVQLPAGYYDLRISFLGFNTLTESVLIEYESVDLGQIILMENSIALGEFTVVGKLIPVVLKGDTTEINAGAYTSNVDADASDLIAKMPTVTMENATIKAEGETVQKVLVDGKPFFGTDPNAALKSLPAEAIDKIQIFDDLSDQSKLTGFDDGNSEKTINIITKKEFRDGTFGYVSGGYGTDDRYRANGVVNSFKGDQRITVIAQSNNINQQNFATSDLAGVTSGSGGSRGGPGGGGPRRPGGNTGGDASDFLIGEEDGIATTDAVGINYTNSFGKKLTLNASYFYNKTDNNVLSNTERYYFSDSVSQSYFENERANSINQNHRFNLRLKYEMNENNTFIYTPSFTLQDYDGQSILGTTTSLDDVQISNSESNYNSNLVTYQLKNELMWQHKFAKRGRSLSMHVSQEASPTDADSYLLSQSGSDVFLNSISQESHLQQTNNEYFARAMYTEPLAKKLMLKTFVGASVKYSDSEKLTYSIDTTTSMLTLQPVLSNTFDSQYSIKEGGAGLMYRMGKKGMLMFDTRLQYATLETNQEFPTLSDATRDYTSLLPMGMFKYSFTEKSNLRVMFRTGTEVPSVSQLQGVVDNSNPQQLTIGNEGLDQQYEYKLFAKYNLINPEKSSTFFLMFGGTATNDYIGTSTTIASADTINVGGITVAPGTQLSMPVNLDGYYNVRAFTTYGFPLAKLKSNLNLNLSAEYTRSPGLINNELNYTQSPTFGLGAVFSSNISKRVDFTLSSNSSMNYSLSSLSPEQNTDYFNQSTSLKIFLNVWDGVVYRTNLTHELYSGLSDSFDSTYFLWSMGVGYKFLKNDKAEIGIEAFDILNQNQSLTRITTDTYYEDVYTNALQRYFMLTFRYNFGKYNLSAE